MTLASFSVARLIFAPDGKIFDYETGAARHSSGPSTKPSDGARRNSEDRDRMENPPDGWPRIAPAVFYDDAAAAIDWLTRAFGFEVQVRVENDRGQIAHSQLVLDGGLIMVGQVGLRPDRTYPQSPCAVGGANTQALAVYVDDVDAHCEQARSAGAVITVEPATQDYGEGYWTDRTYEARDLEGHHWWFMQRLRT